MRHVCAQGKLGICERHLLEEQPQHMTVLRQHCPYVDFDSFVCERHIPKLDQPPGAWISNKPAIKVQQKEATGWPVKRSKKNERSSPSPLVGSDTRRPTTVSKVFDGGHQVSDRTTVDTEADTCCQSDPSGPTNGHGPSRAGSLLSLSRRKRRTYMRL